MKHDCTTLREILGREPFDDGRYWEATAVIDTCIGGTRQDLERARDNQFRDVSKRNFGFQEKEYRHEN